MERNLEAETERIKIERPEALHLFIILKRIIELEEPESIRISPNTYFNTLLAVDPRRSYKGRFLDRHCTDATLLRQGLMGWIEGGRGSTIVYMHAHIPDQHTVIELPPHQDPAGMIHYTISIFCRLNNMITRASFCMNPSCKTEDLLNS